ncbi:DUF1648 domain-containing protein [Nocardioides sp. BGMRC 2183]|nr:DUF1648 domain-containing protein [Nocardioides sp. BGMRC 2183]
MTPPAEPAEPADPGTPRPALVAFAGSAVVYAAAWLVAYLELPDRVPLHFGVGGGVDRWGEREDALITFAVLGIAMTALFAGVAYARIPTSMLNVPHKSWWTATPEREQRMRMMMREDGLRLGAVTLLFLAVALLLTVRASALAEPHLDAWFAVALGLYCVVMIGYTVYAYRARYRRD